MRFEKSSFWFIPVFTPPLLPSPPQTQIIFENRLGTRDVGKDCTMTVNEIWNELPHPAKGHCEERGTPSRPLSTQGSLPCTTYWVSKSSRGT